MGHARVEAEDLPQPLERNRVVIELPTLPTARRGRRARRPHNSAVQPGGGPHSRAAEPGGGPHSSAAEPGGGPHSRAAEHGGGPHSRAAEPASRRGYITFAFCSSLWRARTLPCPLALSQIIPQTAISRLDQILQCCFAFCQAKFPRRNLNRLKFAATCASSISRILGFVGLSMLPFISLLRS